MPKNRSVATTGPDANFSQYTAGSNGHADLLRERIDGVAGV